MRGGFIRGFTAAFAGFRLLMRPGIRIYVLTPLLVNTVLFGLILWFGASAWQELIHRVSTGNEWLAWAAWLLWPLFIVAALILLFYGFVLVANLIGGPFNGLLAAAVERILTEQPPVTQAASTPATLLTELVADMRVEVVKLAYLLTRSLPLLVLMLIPGLQLLMTPLGVLLAAWMLALEYLEYPLGNHGMKFPEVRAHLARHRRLCLGFGLGVLVLTLIPVLNFIAMPVAVISATRLSLDGLSGKRP